MTPKARRHQQLMREAATRSATEAAIEVFKLGQPAHKATRLISARKTAKKASRCYGCGEAGFPLEVWEYQEVAGGPAILCGGCADKAEAVLRATAPARRAATGRGGAGRAQRRRE